MQRADILLQIKSDPRNLTFPKLGTTKEDARGAKRHNNAFRGLQTAATNLLIEAAFKQLVKCR